MRNMALPTTWRLDLTTRSRARLTFQMHLDEAAVIARARDGDEDACRALVDEHSRGVYRMAYRMMGCVEDAEDVVQETFVRAFNQLGRFEARAHFRTWLYRIAFNCAIDAIRARTPHERREAPDVLDALSGNGHVPSSEDLVYAGEIGARVQGALTALSAQERAAFLMRHSEGCSIDEISAALNLTASAAKHAVFRGVRKMRHVLRPFVDVAAAKE